MIGGSLPGTPVSSTNNTGRNDIAEILLKMALSTRNQIKRTDSSFLASSQLSTSIHCPYYFTVHVYVVIHIDANLCTFFYHLFVCIAVGESVIKRGGLGSH
jgi:hypothetical protein